MNRQLLVSSFLPGGGKGGRCPKDAFPLLENGSLQMQMMLFLVFILQETLGRKDFKKQPSTGLPAELGVRRVPADLRVFSSSQGFIRSQEKTI